MKTRTINLEELFNSANAFINMMEIKGIPTKVVYWLGKNQAKIMTEVKKSQKHHAAITNSFTELIPQHPIIPYSEYMKFKTALLGCEIPISSIFAKYEVIPEAKIGIPVEKQQALQEAISKASEEFMCTLEYDEVQIPEDKKEYVMMQLSAKDQLALEFMWAEPSKLTLASDLKGQF